MNTDRQIVVRNEILMSARLICREGHELHRKQMTILENWFNFRGDGLFKKLPRYEQSYIQGYFDALMNKYGSDLTIFRYIVDGQQYRTKRYDNPELPYWDTLLRDDWDSLRDKGHSVYRDNGAIYF